MRRQYYFRQSDRGLLAWDVNRLIALSRDFPVRQIPLSDVREIDEPFDDPPSWRAMVEHIRFIEAANLRYPIILSSEGRVMDGMHRVVKTLLAGQATVDAVRFPADPEPDYIDVDPAQLPYDELAL